MRGFFFAVLAALIIIPHVASAQEKAGLKPGFTLSPGTAKILVLRPRVTVGAQSTAGLFEPNADWTQQARENLNAALASAQRTLGNEIIEAPDYAGPNAERLAEYQSLFAVLAASVIEYQFFPGNRLPTKKRKGEFDWTLGPGLANVFKETGAKYALFLWTEDQFGSTGRKVLQVFAAMARISVSSGVHKGYAGLIDIETGDLVWLNADMQMGGDVRSSEGATKRMAQLLEDFPGSTKPSIAASVAK